MDEPEEMGLKYVRGYFDRLCSVDVQGRAIVLTTNQVDLAKRVAAALRAHWIKCAIIPQGERVKLRVSGRESLLTWKEHVGFKDPGKEEKLDKILSSYAGGDGANR